MKLFIAHTTFKLTISPFAFLTFRSFIKKYQKRDFATTVLGANILIRYNFGVGFASDGRWRPMTWYSVRRPIQKSASIRASSEHSKLCHVHLLMANVETWRIDSEFIS